MQKYYSGVYVWKTPNEICLQVKSNKKPDVFDKSHLLRVTEGKRELVRRVSPKQGQSL